MEFDTLRGFEILEDLARSTAPPATVEEICDQALASIAKALEASGGALFLTGSNEDDRSPVLRGSWGASERAERAIADPALASPARGESTVDDDLLAIPIPGASRSEGMGMLVLDKPRFRSSTAQVFAKSAAQSVSSSLQAARKLTASREEGLLLVQRNAELEVLRELTDALPARDTEEAALQGALDLVLDKLGLEAGWIFWGDSRREDLQLAAYRGIAEDFVRRARDKGIGTCLCRDVFATGRLRYARNTVDCPRLPDLVCGSGVMAHACIPLKFERGIMGVMNIMNHPGRLFSAAELKFLEIVGNQLCLAVDKLQTARAEHRSNAEARALVSLAQAIGGSLEIERVLSAVGDYARELLNVDRCAILLGSRPSEFRFAYLSGAPLEGVEPGRVVDFDSLEARGIVEALTEGRTLVVHDGDTDPRIGRALARRWALASGVFVPLMARRELKGVLVAGRYAPSRWTEEDTALADALARHAAVAVENARLFKEAHEALASLQQAQWGMMRAERLAALGTVAASLAHEVRNPLNSINLQLVLMSRRVAGVDPRAREDLSGLVSTAQQEITRLDALVEDFLSMSSIDRLHSSELDVNQVVRDVLLLMGSEAREKGVSIVEALEASLPRALLDREKIEQVLINLVKNALQAMPEGGTLTLTTRSDGNTVRIDVGDTGSGIPPGVDVFDFFTTTKRGGTGLGLPIARRIAEAHGGSLTYTSEPGVRTIFTVELRAERSI